MGKCDRKKGRETDKKGVLINEVLLTHSKLGSVIQSSEESSRKNHRFVHWGQGSRGLYPHQSRAAPGNIQFLVYSGHENMGLSCILRSMG
jgi:hypothetical protein